MKQAREKTGVLWFRTKQVVEVKEVKGQVCFSAIARKAYGQALELDF